VKINFLQEAQFELDDAIEYYNNQLENLGYDFLNEVLSAIDRVVAYKEAWHPLSENTRRCQTRRFPYGVIYSILDDSILIISISNLHREPNHWRNRIQ